MRLEGRKLREERAVWGPNHVGTGPLARPCRATLGRLSCVSPQILAGCPTSRFLLREVGFHGAIPLGISLIHFIPCHPERSDCLANAKQRRSRRTPYPRAVSRTPKGVSTTAPDCAGRTP